MLVLGGQGLSCRLLVPETPENGGLPVGSQRVLLHGQEPGVAPGPQMAGSSCVGLRGGRAMRTRAVREGPRWRGQSCTGGHVRFEAGRPARSTKESQMVKAQRHPGDGQDPPAVHTGESEAQRGGLIGHWKSFVDSNAQRIQEPLTPSSGHCETCSTVNRIQSTPLGH